MPSTKQAFISVDEAASLFGVSTRTIRRRIADNTIPAYRTGRQIRMRRADAEAALLAPMNESARQLLQAGGSA